jgi:hypothetical protein
MMVENDCQQVGVSICINGLEAVLCECAAQFDMFLGLAPSGAKIFVVMQCVVDAVWIYFFYLL